jgi:hypothetical protein
VAELASDEHNVCTFPDQDAREGMPQIVAVQLFSGPAQAHGLRCLIKTPPRYVTLRERRSRLGREDEIAVLGKRRPQAMLAEHGGEVREHHYLTFAAGGLRFGWVSLLSELATNPNDLTLEVDIPPLKP